MAAVTRWNPEQGPVQMSTLRALLQREGKATAWWSDVPGAKSGERARHWPETRWMVSGYLRVRLEGQTIDLAPGDRLDLPPDTPHTTEVVGLGTAIYLIGTSDSSLVSISA
ncbi:MAG TPA: cupin domain-containing protein [Gemmatimonadales bacterium]|nr:cupin domain-containing protein [Gemmatimonadales bacterium]